MSIFTGAGSLVDWDNLWTPDCSLQGHSLGKSCPSGSCLVAHLLTHRKQWQISRIQGLLAQHFVQWVPFFCLCGCFSPSPSVCLTSYMCVWVCLSAPGMFVSASAQPYRADCTTGGQALGSELLAVIAVTPISLSCSETSCSCWHSWRFHRVPLLFPLIYLWHTLPCRPFNSHTHSPDCTHLPAKESNSFPHSELRDRFSNPGREDSGKEDFYDFLSIDSCIVFFFWRGELFIPIITVFELPCSCVKLGLRTCSLLPLACVVRF